VLAFEHDVFLKLCVFDLVVFNQNVFPDNFNGIQLLVKLKFSQEYLSESAFPQYDDHFEIGKSWLSCSIFSRLSIIAY